MLFYIYNLTRLIFSMRHDQEDELDVTYVDFELYVERI